MKNRVRNIILDFGGVILPINYQAPISAFAALGVNHFDKVFTQEKQHQFLDAFDKGLISSEDFCDEVRHFSNCKLTDAQIIEAWNSILLSFPNEKKLLLEKLSTKYNLYLLSNTNEIHIQKFEEIIVKQFGKNILHDYFKRIYYSSRIHLRKPNIEVFEFVIQDNLLDVSETIFIDDSIQHVKGANCAGIKAYWLNLKEHKLESLIKNIGLL